MDVLREFGKEPPHEPLDSLEALVRDFRWRFPRERRDMVVEYCRAAPDLITAITRAVLSKNAEGKHHNHQSKVKRTAYSPMIMLLCSPQVLGELRRASTFDAIHDIVEDYAVPGWGEVGIYDIATRIAAYKGVEPTSVYLHAGVRQGWYALMEAIRGTFDRRTWASVKRIPHEHLPEALRVLTADEVEDFLCTYRTVFVDLKEA